MSQEASPAERLTEIADTMRGVVDVLEAFGFLRTSRALRSLADEIDRQVERWLSKEVPILDAPYPALGPDGDGVGSDTPETLRSKE